MMLRYSHVYGCIAFIWRNGHPPFKLTSSPKCLCYCFALNCFTPLRLFRLRRIYLMPRVSNAIRVLNNDMLLKWPFSFTWPDMETWGWIPSVYSESKPCHLPTFCEGKETGTVGNYKGSWHGTDKCLKSRKWKLVREGQNEIKRKKDAERKSSFLLWAFPSSFRAFLIRLCCPTAVFSSSLFTISLFQNIMGPERVRKGVSGKNQRLVRGRTWRCFFNEENKTHPWLLQQWKKGVHYSHIVYLQRKLYSRTNCSYTEIMDGWLGRNAVGIEVDPSCTAKNDKNKPLLHMQMYPGMVQQFTTLKITK